MSTNQQARRGPGRSGNYSHHQNKGYAPVGMVGGGGGRGGAAGAPPQHPSRSFKKSGNGQGAQPILNTSVNPGAPITVAVANNAFNQKSDHPQAHGQPEPPIPVGAKLADSNVSKTSGTKTGPRPPHPVVPAQTAVTAYPAAPAASVPTMAVKGSGDAATMQFNLQFGTICPGMMNGGVQIPARTSSAPPNLDEQKRDQDRHDSLRVVPTLPMPSLPKPLPHQARKDVSSVGQRQTVEMHPPTQIKRDMQSQLPPTAVTTPNNTVLPMAGVRVPVPVQYQQSQATVQFTAPGSQLQSQGLTCTALQMPMTLPVANASQVQQQMFVPFQSHHLQSQAMVHQAQSLGFPPQISHQIPGNIGITMVPQFAQHQQPSQFSGQRKTTVKITHPDTREELRLDKRTDAHIDGGGPSGQRTNITSHSQPGPAFAPQMNYYHAQMPPNSFSSSTLFYPNHSSLPMSTQMTPSSHYGFSINQSAPMQFMNQSVLNQLTGAKSAFSVAPGASETVNLEALPIPSHSVLNHVTAKPSIYLSVEKNAAPVKISAPASRTDVTNSKPKNQLAEASFAEKGATSFVRISTPASKDEKQKSMTPVLENSLVDKFGSVTSTEITSTLTKVQDNTDIHQQRNRDITVDCSQHQKGFVEQSSMKALSSIESHSRGIADEHVQRIESETPSPYCASLTGDSCTSVSVFDGRKVEHIRRSDSLKDHPKKSSKKDVKQSQQENEQNVSDSVRKTVEDCAVVIVAAQEDSNKSEQPLSVTDGPSSSSHLPSSISADKIALLEEVEDERHVSVSHSSGMVLPEMPLQDILGKYSDDLNTDNKVPKGESASIQTSAILGPSIEIDSSESPNLFEFKNDQEERLEEKECSKAVASIDHHEHSSNVIIHPDSNILELSEAEQAASVKQEGRGLDVVNISKINDYEEQQNGSWKDERSSFLEAVGALEEGPKDAFITSHFVDAYSDTCSSQYPDNEDVSSNTTSNKIVDVCNQDVVSSDSVVSNLGTTSVPVPASPFVAQQLNGKIGDLSFSSTVSVPKDKTLSDTTRVKSTAGKKKKRKEICSKADAAGASDLYNAYKSTMEKHENSTIPMTTSGALQDDLKSLPMDFPTADTILNGEDGESKTDIDDWEDVADISTPNLKTACDEQNIDGIKKLHENENDSLSVRKYSRDFLLTLSEQCRETPMGFSIGSDIADVLLSGPIDVAWGHVPQGAQRMDRDAKWNKTHGSSGPGRDSRFDATHAATGVSFRAGQGVNHGVLRNPRGQTSSGGILSGPIQSISPQIGAPRHGVDADRWHRGASTQRGLMPSPQAPSQAMHKATKRYEIGRVSDEEEAKQRQLKSILNKLTPQNFEKLFLQVKEVNIDNTTTLAGVISQIFDKALMEPTFCEMYADFCSHLAGALPDFIEENEKITFRRLLLNKCQEEFEREQREEEEASKTRVDGEVKQSEEEREVKRIKARRRMLGNIRLIGELYKKRMLTERIMHECIKKLIGQYQEDPDEEDIEALCKLMSTIGVIIDHQKAKEHMDAYFEVMLKLSMNQKLSSRVRFMLKDAIDLRKNKWQQRRKVEGPKKIEEVHRDAAQERHAHTGRMGRGPVSNSSTRRELPADYSSRGTSVLPFLSSQQTGSARAFTTQNRGHSTQDFRMEDRTALESKTMSVTLPQKNSDDDSITLGPQGGLARGMSVRGQSLMPNAPPADSRRMASSSNAPGSSGISYDQLGHQDRSKFSGIQEPRVVDHSFEKPSSSSLSSGHVSGSTGSNHVATSESKVSSAVLRKKSLSAIEEFYSAKDVDEVAFCVKDLDSPNFYPDMVSVWVTNSFEKKEKEIDDLTGLLIDLCKSRCLLSQLQLIKGLETVMSELEDTVNDAPKAPEFLGCILSKFILENVVPFREVGRLLREGGEEKGRLLEIGLAADVLGSILLFIKSKKEDSYLTKICREAELRLEDFMPPQHKSTKLDDFLP